MNLSISTYNCYSMNKNVDIIRKLINDKIDILLLQETLLVADDLYKLDYLDEDYISIGIPAVLSEKCISSGSGRPKGGLACIWKRNSYFDLKMVEFDDDYMLIELTTNNLKFYLLNVYIRSDLGDPASHNAYLEFLYKLEIILNKYDQNVFLLGDFNADPFYGNTWHNLSNFINRNNLNCFDKDLLDDNSFTYVSFTDSHCKWLDHVIGRVDCNIEVKGVHVKNEYIGSDHLPLVLDLYLLNVNEPNINNHCGNENMNNDYINWNKLNNEDLKNIVVNACINQGVFRDREIGECVSTHCTSSSCRSEISKLYNDIVDSVKIASSRYHQNTIKKSKFKVVPGWNRCVKEAYQNFRVCFKDWIYCGRPRNVDVFHEMKDKQKIFKKKLKECKRNEANELSLSIENSFSTRNHKKFWNEI